MSIFHCSIKIIRRSVGRSAVAAAAYRAGVKLYDEETGLLHDFTNKNGVIMSEIVLPPNAPEIFKDRQTLWNEVERIESRSDAQFAREFEFALPVEMTLEQWKECIKTYVMKNFVSKGMIVDWAIHDKKDGNPHVHIMVTLRGLNEQGQWLQKQKTVFANARDEQGKPIYDPALPTYDPKDKERTAQYRIPQLDNNGNQKVRIRKGKGTEYLWEKISIPVNEWNEQSNAEIWRESWAKICNCYLNPEDQIDHRSYARQGLNKIPTIHEGYVARQMEAEGKTAERCQINRDIRVQESLRIQLQQLMREMTELIIRKARELYERYQKFRRGFGDSEVTGRDANLFGKAANENHGFGKGKEVLGGTAGRIAAIKRNIIETGESIKVTGGPSGNIATTAKRIEDTNGFVLNLRSSS